VPSVQSMTTAIVLKFPPWRVRKVVKCGCGCPLVMTNRSDDGQPRFATPNCSLAWHRDNDPKRVITMMSGLRS
jgi:hypothetical protein